jgi:hypothetical protein
MKLNAIKGVTRKIEQGAWVRQLPNLPGVAVKVRGYGNSDYRRILAKLRADMTADAVADPAEQEKMDGVLMHESILMDWDGIEDFPFSSENSLKILTDPELAAFRMGVNYAASVVAREGTDSAKEAEKN